VLLLEYGQTSILFTGDATSIQESEIINSIAGPVDILKVAHHGSRFSTSRYFLDILQPAYAMISVGRNNYGHPHSTLINRLEEVGALIYRTDLDGDILITSLGGEPEVFSKPLIY
jgi:competence protein ComEC